MEYLIEALVNKTRNNAALATEVGSDANSNVKVYHAIWPRSLATVSYPYVVFHILPGGDVIKTFGGSVVYEWPVQFDIYDDAQSVRRCVEIMQRLIECLDECSLDGLAYTETSASPEPGAMTTYRVMQDGTERVNLDADEIWHASVDFLVGLNAA